MKFVSRKNQVTLENGEVVKRYCSTNALVREADALKSLAYAGLAVPRLISTNQNVLKMEYVPGETYLEHVDLMTFEKAHALTRWLTHFQRLTGFVKADVNLRNFIWTGTTCVGLDFEDSPLRGELELCFGKVLAFAVTYTPAFTPAKARCAGLLLQSFLVSGAKPAAIRNAYSLELRAMNLRRKNVLVDIERAISLFDQTLERTVDNRAEGGVL
ncbi:MAG: hypothetical protein GX971_03605 [Firmicutes bacterium]|nr:hypothetical protein [Bacillota bacterium]